MNTAYYYTILFVCLFVYLFIEPGRFDMGPESGVLASCLDEVLPLPLGAKLISSMANVKTRVEGLFEALACL